MSALRFAAGLGAGIALAALVAGAIGRDAPGAAEPEPRLPPARAETAPAAPAAPPTRRVAEAKEAVARGSVAPGVLARAAASRQTKAPAAPRASGAAPSGPRDVVIESVEVDWGDAPARP